MNRIRVVPALLALLMACSSSDLQAPKPEEKPTPTPAVPVAETRLSVDEAVDLEWNGSVQLRAVALDAQGKELSGRVVKWYSSKPSVFTVSNDGLITAVAPGNGGVTAIIEGVPSTVGVRVKTAPVTDVLLDVPTAAEALEVGEIALVGTRVKLVSGQIVDRPLSWTSSDTNIATATSTAQGTTSVVAFSSGVVTLTGTSEGKSASVTIRITPRPTHDLIYSRWNAAGESEIFVLSLAAAGATPVRMNAGNVSFQPSPSPDGQQFVFAISQIDQLGRDQNDLYIVNRNGTNMRQLTSDPGVEWEPKWSPDGTKIVFSATDAALSTHSLWVVNVDGTGLKKLTTALPADVLGPDSPAWSPDGRRIAFVARRNGQHKIWTMNADGSNPVQLTTDAAFDAGPTWSPDGASIAFSRYNVNAPDIFRWDIAIVPATGGAVVMRELPGDQLAPAWSPDGQYLAVQGASVDGRGVTNLYTMRPDGSGLRLRTVAAAWGGGLAPAWVRRW
ncbi:MAG TPA: LpqB family beta-propeller domain-containing protein [Gemmatimonadaceae bacterium]